jgi:hypothetical protein
MAKDMKKEEAPQSQPQVVPRAVPVEKPVVEVVAQPVEKIRFMVWFSGLVHKSEKVKPHHMHTVRSYFDSLGIGGEATESEFIDGLKKFGYDL